MHIVWIFIFIAIKSGHFFNGHWSANWFCMNSDDLRCKFQTIFILFPFCKNPFRFQFTIYPKEMYIVCFVCMLVFSLHSLSITLIAYWISMYQKILYKLNYAHKKSKRKQYQIDMFWRETHFESTPKYQNTKFIRKLNLLSQLKWKIMHNVTGSPAQFELLIFSSNFRFRFTFIRPKNRFFFLG